MTIGGPVGAAITLPFDGAGGGCEITYGVGALWEGVELTVHVGSPGVGGGLTDSLRERLARCGFGGATLRNISISKGTTSPDRSSHKRMVSGDAEGVVTSLICEKTRQVNKKCLRTASM